MYKLSILKKMFKESLKTKGLVIGEFENGLFYIKGNWWAIFYDSIPEIPKEIMGLLITMVGELPGKGNAFRDYGTGDHQIEMLDREILKSIDSSGDEKYIYTQIVINGRKPRIVIQNEMNKDLKMVDERTRELVRMMSDGEIVKGPTSNINSQFIMWQGKHTVFVAAAEEKMSDMEAENKFLDEIINVIPV